MDFKKILLAAAVLSASLTLHAQNVGDMRISEIQVDSVSIDNGYGEKAGWIEILNVSYGTVKFSGCFLTNDRSNLKKYFIPKRDSNTKVAPRQSVLFFADGDPDKGAFHTNFTLKKGETVYLVSNDGRTIIDSLSIPAELEAGKSIAKFSTDNKEMVFDEIRPANPTPGSYNVSGIQKTKAEVLSERDPHGWVITLTSVSVVFCALIILFICYSIVGAISTGKFAAAFRKLKPARKPKSANAGAEAEIAAAIAMALQMERGGETEAAIALALDRYFTESIHDNESYIITIKRK